MDSRVPVKLMERFLEEYSESQARLGLGSFGSVHLVKDRSGKQRAAKLVCIREGFHKTSLRREVQILWELKSSGCEYSLELMDYFEDIEQGILVTDYLTGGELFSRCSRKHYRFTEGKCKLFATNLLQALAFIHSKYIIHLDLKPENIMFASQFSEQLKLIDFGLARIIPTYGRVPSLVVGTVGFMAPEIASCHHASPASDLWSLGCVLYMLLSGGLEPFWKPGRPAVTTQRRASRGTYSWPDTMKETVSTEAKDLVSRMLAVRPKDRITAEEALHHTWLEEVTCEGERKPSEVLDTTSMRSWLARRRWLRAGTALRALQRMGRLARRRHGEQRQGEEEDAENCQGLDELVDFLDRLCQDF